jgi:peptidyl-prolyl cis-trans isomerase C
MALLAASCQSQPQSSPVSAASALGGDVARVGETTIPAAVVSAVSAASSESPRDALEAVVRDALAAGAARAAGLDRIADVAWATRAALARQVVRRSMAASAAEGPPRPGELENVQVAHAVVLRSARLPEAREVAIADAIRSKVDGASSVDEFERRAAATPHADAQVVVEQLAAFGADGRSSTGEIDASFVAAAFGLHSPGELSGVVETRFGWHVIFLVGRTAPEGDNAGRSDDLAASVAELRARGRLESFFRERRRTSRIEVLGVADSMMAEVKVP